MPSLPLLIIMLIFFPSLQLASASLYPIKPVSTTIYRTGESSLIQWKDDLKYPRLNETGLIAAKLFREGDKYIATLATNIKPMGLSARVTFPVSCVNASDYFIKFDPPPPQNPIYSASFIVVSSGDGLTISSPTPNYQTNAQSTAPGSSSSSSSTTQPTTQVAAPQIKSSASKSTRGGMMSSLLLGSILAAIVS